MDGTDAIGGAAHEVDHAGLEILERDECVELIRSVGVARVGFVEDGAPVVLPVNIAWWDGAIVFSTERGSKLDAALSRSPVVIELDDWDAMTQSGWSVLVKGQASTVTDGREIDALDRLSVRSFVRPDRPKHWVSVRIGSVSGRRAEGDRPGGADRPVRRLP
jgi:nitroimidazol reductase NimA-like FMN-containing flavoprotein (pyridoxamine 5'-phosphate oxidase superfamily)